MTRFFVIHVPLLFVALLAWPGSSKAQQQELSLVLRIGEAEEGPEYILGRIPDVAFGPGGEIYVLDSSDAQVKVFDASGTHLHSFGRRGDGPGEMRSPSRILVSHEQITVFDPFQSRAVRFTPEGEHIETRRIEELPPHFSEVVPVRYGQWLAGTSGFSYGSLLRLAGQSPRTIRREGPAARAGVAQVVALISADQAALDTVFTYDPGFVYYIMPTGAGMLDRYLGRGGYWTVGGDSAVAFVDSFQGEVRIFHVQPGGLELHEETRLPIVPEELDEGAWRQIEESVRAERDLRQDIEVIGPPFRAQVGYPLFSDDGSLWVRELDMYASPGGRGPSTNYYILSPNDSDVASVRVPSGFTIRAIRGNLLLGTRLSEFHEPLVEVWRIRRSGS